MSQSSSASAPVVVSRFFVLPLLVIAGLVAIWLGYRETVMSLYEQWISSESYSHGLIVVPITLYFIWMRRVTLYDAAIEPSSVGMSAILVSGLLWVLGELAGVVTVTQIALVCLTISFVWAVLGSDFTRRIAFPLGFLFLAIPFSDGILPHLMRWTADATVMALRWSGVPVYQDGVNFVIPSGNWSVVEACAGGRYLVSSLFAGALYAYITYTQPTKRAITMLLALIIPLFANWLRAYTIVIVAHLTNNEWGLGVSHITLGWIIFGAVILLMFWLGMRWRDPEPVAKGLHPGSDRGPAQRHHVALAIAFFAVLIWQGVAAWRAPSAEGLGAIAWPSVEPAEGWMLLSADPDVHSTVVGERASLQGHYAQAEGKVLLFMHAFAEQSQGREMINRFNHIELPPGHTSRAFSEAELDLAGAGVPFKREVHRRIDTGEGFAVYRSYNVRGHWTSSDYEAKAMQALGRLLAGRDDSAMVVVVTPAKGDASAGHERVTRFLAAHGAAIQTRVALAVDGGSEGRP
ncbi:exosortase A [Methyloversatilis sp.]|uniref:exosortase A n=1 Tax=Methyloversatilis sp. TaxID=2569862 RepID=UPI0027B94F18|nr:exosortase A [Methyloversatilis sp.]